MIRIYVIENCMYCNELKDLLTKENIPFMDIDINLLENVKEFDKINAIAKSDSVPIVLVNKRILVPEKSFQTIQEAFNLIKKFMVS